MAVPFYIPEEDNSQAENTTNPIPIPSQSPQSPQISPIDNDMIVQALYEALCRCSQNFTPSVTSPSASPLNRGQFWFPSPSTSAVSSPRGSFRGARRRLNSYGSQSQYSQYSEDSIEEYDEDLLAWEHHYQQREQMEEFTAQLPQPKTKSSSKSNKKPKQSGKITTFVISALQFVIDSLK